MNTDVLFGQFAFNSSQLNKHHSKTKMAPTKRVAPDENSQLLHELVSILNSMQMTQQAISRIEKKSLLNLHQIILKLRPN